MNVYFFFFSLSKYVVIVIRSQTITADIDTLVVFFLMLQTTQSRFEMKWAANKLHNK